MFAIAFGCIWCICAIGAIGALCKCVIALSSVQMCAIVEEVGW